MARTKDFATIYGYAPNNQTATTAADLWGGANVTTLGVGHKFQFEELKIEDTPEFVEDTSRNGTQLAVGQELQAVTAKFSGKTKIYTQGPGVFMAQTLGWEDLEGPKAVSANYSHLYYFNPSGKEQRLFTSAEVAKMTGGLATDAYQNHFNALISEGPSDLILKNGIVTEFEFACSTKDALSLSFSGVGESVTRDTGKTQSAALTAPAASFSNFYAMRHMTACTINAVSYNVTDFSIKGKFGVIDAQQSSTTGTKYHYPYSDGSSELTFEASIFLHDQDVLKALEQNQTSVPIKLGFTRGTNQIMFLMPAVRLSSVSVDYASGGSVKVSGKLFNLTAVDTTFTAERSLSGTEQGLDFPSPLQIVYVDGLNVHGLRAQ